MRFTIASDQFTFFKDHGYIGFHDLFSAAYLLQLESAVTKNERDLFRSSPAIQELVFNKTLAEIAGKLTNNKNIRFGFDQSICSDTPLEFGGKICTLESISCIQPLACGLILRLTDQINPPKTTLFCPRDERGVALFFSPKILLSLLPLFEEKKQKFILIGYAYNKPQYIANKQDPFVHQLKSLGYAFGDHLDTTTHPILFSSF